MTHVFERLIVPLDGSQASLAATNLAIRMALASDAEVTFAHAINRAAIVAECTSVYGGDAGMALDELDEYGKSILEEAKALAEGRGVRARALLLDGAPAHAIVTLATGNGADAIVMGNRPQERPGTSLPRQHCGRSHSCCHDSDVCRPCRRKRWIAKGSFPKHLCRHRPFRCRFLGRRLCHRLGESV